MRKQLFLTLFLLGIPVWAFCLGPQSDLKHPFDIDAEKLQKRLEQIDRRLGLEALERGFDWRIQSVDELIPKCFPLLEGRQWTRLGDGFNFFLQPKSPHEPLIVLRQQRFSSNFDLWPEFEIPVLQTGVLPSKLFGVVEYHVYPSLNKLAALLNEDPALRRRVALQFFVKSAGINPDWISPSFQPIIDTGVMPDRKKYLRKQDNADLEFYVAQLIEQKETDGTYPDFSDDLIRRPRPNVLLETQVYAMVFHELFHDAFFTRAIGPAGRKEFESLVFFSEDPQVQQYMDRFEEVGGVRLLPALFRGKGAVKAVALSEVFARFAAIYYEQVLREKILQTQRDHLHLTGVFHQDTGYFNSIPFPEKFKQFFNKYRLLLLKKTASESAAPNSIGTSL